MRWTVDRLAWLVVLAVGGCGPDGGAAGSDESSSGGDTTASPADDDDDDDDDDDSTTDGSDSETGEDTTTADDDSTGTETGEPVEVPELEFVIQVQRPDDVERHLERFVMIDGEFSEPIQASEPIPGSAQVIRSQPVDGRRQMIYQSQNGADDNVYLADYSDPNATVYQQLDVDAGAVSTIFATAVGVVSAAPIVMYSGDSKQFVVPLEVGGAGDPVLVYEAEPPVSASVYLREPSSTLAFVGINDGDTGELWLSDLAADPSALIPVGSPTTPWQSFLGGGVLPNDSGIVFRSDVVGEDLWDAFVAPLEDGVVGPTQAITSVTPPAYVSWVETHPYSDAVVYTWRADDEAFGQSEYYWVPLEGTEPGEPVALNNDGLGRVNERKYSASGRFLAYEGAPLHDGTLMTYSFIDFEGGSPSAPVDLGISSSGQVTFHRTDRWLYYYDGPPFDLYRADLTADPVEHQLVAEGVASWGTMSPDGTVLCLDDDEGDAERFRLVDVSGDTIEDSTVIEVDVPGERWARFCTISEDGRYLFYNEAASFIDRALVVLDLEDPEVPLLRIEADSIDGPWHLPALR